MISNIDSSDIIAISAVVLALCAFVLTFYGIILNKKHNQLSVRPFFNLDTDDDPISLTLINRGQGNGIILSLNVKYNKNIRIINNQYELSGLFKEIWNSEPLPFTFDYKLPVGRAGVNVGESIEIFKIEPFKNSEDAVDSIIKKLSEVTFIVHFECLYKNKFLVQNNFDY